MKILLVDQIAKVNYKYSFSLCNELKNAGLDIGIVIDTKEDLSECNVKTYSLFNSADKDKGKLKKMWNYIRSWKRIIDIMAREKYDILHVQWFLLSPIDYYFISKINKMKIKIIVTIHDILPFNKRFYDYRYHEKIYSCADKIIVQAKGNVSRFNDVFPQYSSRVVYIPHGNFVEYANIHDKKSAKRYLDLPDDKKVILFFGQIKKVKGLGILIEAFANVCSKRKDIFLVIAGNVWNDNFDIYSQKINEFGISDNVRCDIKYIPDEEIEYYYSASDVNVLPYLNVYQSGVIQLAYAYCKPVIATKVGAFLEVVYDDVNGLLIEPNSVSELENAIYKIFENETKMINMGINGNELMKDKYSWQKISKSLYNIYYEV